MRLLKIIITQQRYLLFLLFTLAIISCSSEQVVEEEQLIEEETQEEASIDLDDLVQSDDPMMNLLRSMAMNDVASNNALEDSNCMTLQFPVTILFHEVEITIFSEEELAQLSNAISILEDEDFEFIFPMTVTLEDYSELTFNNQEEFAAFIEECYDFEEDNNEDDDEYADNYSCITIEFPLNFTIYDENGDFVQSASANNEEELYEILADFENSQDIFYIDLNFPINLLLPDGTTAQANNEDELEAIFENAEGCWDEDTYEDNDDWDYEEGDCLYQDLGTELAEDCSWYIWTVSENTAYIANFSGEGTINLQAYNPVGEITGTGTTTWNVNVSEDDITLTIGELPSDSLPVDISGDWTYMYCDYDVVVFTNENNEYIALYQDQTCN